MMGNLAFWLRAERILPREDDMVAAMERSRP
jgi:hypothetical protein